MGIASLALLAFSYLGSRASKEEAYFRNMSMLCLLFSFPIVAIGDTKLFATPFFVESLFPMLPVLRVPVRFMLFALLFLSVAVGLILKRLPETIGAAKGKAVVLVIALLLLAQQWPAMDRFVFNTPVPAFYASLATEPGRISIFLYPPLTYYDLLKEAYAQTIHQKPISSGVLSRPPLPYNPLLALYADAETGAPDPVEISDFVVEHGYDYVVVQKRRCTPFSFAGYSECVPLGGAYLKNATAELGSRFGEPVYEDGWIIVYRSR